MIATSKSDGRHITFERQVLVLEFEKIEFPIII